MNNNKRLLPLTQQTIINQIKVMFIKNIKQRLLLKNMSIILLYFNLFLFINNFFIHFVNGTDLIDNNNNDDDERIVLKRVAPVGKIFTIEEDKNNIIIETPIWLNIKNETSNKNFFIGIPNIAHIGKHLIEFDNGKKLFYTFIYLFTYFR